MKVMIESTQLKSYVRNFKKTKITIKDVILHKGAYPKRDHCFVHHRVFLLHPHSL